MEQQPQYPQQPPPAGPQPPAPPFAPQPPPQPPKKSNAPLIVGIVAAAVVVLCLGCVGIAAFTGGPETSNTSADGNPTNNSTGEASKEAEPKTAKIGESARDGKFEFTVTKAERGRKRVGSEFAGKKAQGEFVFVHITVKNIGDEAQSFFGDNQYLYSTDGKEFSADSEAAVYIENSESLWEEINPGNKVKGIVVFDVPKGTKLDHVELHDSAYSGGVVVDLTK